MDEQTDQGIPANRNLITAFQFPNLLHRNRLLQRCKDEQYTLLTDEERWHYHAYDYGWRRIYLNSRNDRSPIDKKGAWFNSALADDAEKMFRSVTGKDKPRPPENARVREAAEYRERWARAQGCDSFRQALAIGLQRVAKRTPIAEEELPPL